MTLMPILAALITAPALSPDHTMHVALATAMASVFFTSIASVREYRKQGVVD